ncbi:MAG: hypothetical protein LBR56_00150 [Sporomusaceae bacterium]|jgi:hypothetical protein|nr:hypothetical protein [Sporomusaceae bacterium]
MKKSCIFFLLLIFLMNTTVFAHQMLIEPLTQEQKIRVRYIDGSFSPDTTVTVFNAEGQVIFMKKVDGNGEFNYSRYAEADSLMADDGIGHRAVWKVGAQAENVTGKERLIRIVLIVCALAAFGYAFYERTLRKRLEKQYSLK